MKKTIRLLVTVLAIIAFYSCNRNIEKESSKENNTTSEALASNLAKFDTLDFTVFNNQEWFRIAESHSKDIKVYWPDGHVTTGIDKHIEDLKTMFTYAPDTKVKKHLIRIGSGNMTAVTGVLEGTFTKPMEDPNNKGIFFQPTGKSFSLPMCTIGIWGKDGKMTEEHLFWDNQFLMKQIGLQK